MWWYRGTVQRLYMVKVLQITCYMSKTFCVPCPKNIFNDISRLKKIATLKFWWNKTKKVWILHYIFSQTLFKIFSICNHSVFEPAEIIESLPGLSYGQCSEERDMKCHYLLPILENPSDVKPASQWNTSGVEQSSSHLKKK